MTTKIALIALILSLTTACQSQSLLPYSDTAEIENGKSVLTSYTCDDLVEKAQDKSFSLKNLAALRASARCKDFTFNINELSELEKRLYSNEIGNLDITKIEAKLASEYSVKELNAAIKSEKVAAQKFKFYKQLRLKQKKQKNRNDYIKTSDNMYKWALQNFKKNKKEADSYPIFYEASQLTVRSHWTQDNAKKAVQLINESIKLIAPTHSASELYFLKGRIAEESKNTTEAVVQYDLALQDIQKHNPKNLTFSNDRILWLKAWILYKNKNYAESEKAFALLANSTVELSERSRAQFYQARCLKFLNQEAQAKIILESIMQNDFFGYYGLVTYRELGRKMPALKNIKSNNVFKYDLKLNFLSSTEKNIFTDLVKYREFSLSEKAVGLLSKSKQDEVTLALYLAKTNQLYMPLFRAFAKLDNDEKVDVFINFPDYVFPQPHTERVNQMATKTKLPTSLIYSIMKQESAFNEKARSPADAMGLMQVIPRLAKQLSRKFEVPYREPQDLYNPEINIQLGSFELMEQVKKQNGQLTYVAAAYNAGPGALSSWLKTRKRDDVLEFIEEIPYDETRTYVKLIARNKLFYERISNRDNEHEFPNDFLN